jgi:hypothetical protein
MHDRGKNEPVQLVCPRCRQPMIVYLPITEMPRCPNPECQGTRMIIEELLDEGKSF